MKRKPIIISVPDYPANQFFEDIDWLLDEDREREIWQEARKQEMFDGRISIYWQDIYLRMQNGVFRPYLDSYPLAEHISEEVQDGMSILDVGGGSGNIAVFIAQKVNHGKVISIDINETSVQTIRDNSQRYGLDNIISAYHSDIFSNPVVRENAPYDLIVGNLPFVDHWALDDVDRALWDPGLRNYKKLFKKANLYLKPDGSIILAYANFAPIKRLIDIASDNGYCTEFVGMLRASDINNMKERLGLEGEHGVFEEQDRRVFYALNFFV